MKHFTNNPRSISDEELKKLKENILLLGDLSPVIHNARNDEIIGGNQRMKTAGNYEIIIDQESKKPDEVGTLATGRIKTEAGIFLNYRKVDWRPLAKKENVPVEDLEARGNITANSFGGTWDEDVLRKHFENVTGIENFNIPIVYDSPVFINQGITGATNTNNKYRAGVPMVHISLNLVQRKIDITKEESENFIDDLNMVKDKHPDHFDSIFDAMFETAKTKINEILGN